MSRKKAKTLGEELESAAASEDGGVEGGKRRRKKGRGSKRKLLLIPIVLVAALAGVFVWKRVSAGGPVKADRELFLEKANSLGEEAGEEAVPLKAVKHRPKEEEQVESMTMVESISYMEALAPKSLGLEGNSMDEYEVLPVVGTVLVDGVPCTEVYVYRQDERTGTNVFQGSYLLDRSGNALYELNRDEGTVTPLQPQRGGNG